MPSKAKKLNVYRKNHQQGYHNRLRGIRFKASPELSIDQEQLKIAEFLGKGLGKTTGWIHRSALQKKQVQMIAGVDYIKIDDQGLHIKVNDKPQVLEVDNVILCAGQEPLRALQKGLEDRNIITHLIGGADVASELDAKRAIRQGAELAAKI